DRFHELAVPTVSVKQGLSSDTVASVEVADDDSVWLATARGLNRWTDNHIEAYGARGSRAPQRSDFFGSVFQSARGRLWAALLDGLVYVEHGRLIRVDGVRGGNVLSFAEDAAGNLWLASYEHGLLRMSPHGDLQQIPWARLGRNDVATRLLADRVRGGLWLGFRQSGIANFADGQIRTSYSAADGLGDGRVNDLRWDQHGALWVSTEGGLSRLK